MAIYDNGLNPALPNYDPNKVAQATANPTTYTSASSANNPVPAPIAADTLGTANPVTLPTPSTSVSDANAAVTAADNSVKTAQDYYNEQNSIKSPVSDSYNALTESLLNLIPQEAGKASYTAQQENDAGVNDINNSIRKLSSEITTDIAGYNKQFQSQELAPGETPLAIVRGRQAVIQRNQAADIQLKNARLLSLQGDLQAAKDTAQRAVDLKYAPLEEELNIKQQQLQIIQPLLEADQKKQAIALQQKYQDDQQRLADEKAQQKAIQEVALQAAQYGASPDALTAIGKATNPMEAISIAGKYLAAPFKLQQQQTAIAAANAYGPKSAIVELKDGTKAVVTYDRNGNVVNQQPIAEGNDGTDQLKIAQSQDQISSVTSLLNDSTLKAAVGPIALARGGIHLGPIPIIPTTLTGTTGAYQNFVAGVEQLRSGLNLQALIQAKGQGATFGSLSDQELQVLANTATRIGSWAIKNKQGQVVGYNTSEKSFKTELDKINNFAKLDYVLKGGDPSSVGVNIEKDGSLTTINWDGSVTQLLK